MDIEISATSVNLIKFLSDFGSATFFGIGMIIFLLCAILVVLLTKK